jgi:hypothetical protein
MRQTAKQAELGTFAWVNIELLGGFLDAQP